MTVFMSYYFPNACLGALSPAVRPGLTAKANVVSWRSEQQVSPSHPLYRYISDPVKTWSEAKQKTENISI
jgi:hypothetical protein